MRHYTVAQQNSTSSVEIEVKLAVDDLAAFAGQLSALGFRLVTPETLERNTLLDTPDHLLRQRGQLLRIRQYGDRWILTHKSKRQRPETSSYRERLETETEVGDGGKLTAILEQLGYQPMFVYEKCRSEWTDGAGQVVVDVTPIGNYAELEGAHAWIDSVAARLGFSAADYITLSYGQLFLQWKQATHHPAQNMTFAEVGRAMDVSTAPESANLPH